MRSSCPLSLSPICNLEYVNGDGRQKIREMTSRQVRRGDVVGLAVGGVLRLVSWTRLL